MVNEIQEFVATLKAKINIVDILRGYLSLDRKGNNFWACCPFHHEKTPSFSINEPDQYYHCFGCGVSGDVIKFVKEIENVEFYDAVRLLADKVGMQMPKAGADSQKAIDTKKKKDTLLKILNDTAHFYLDNLNSGKADEHINYILSRKMSSHTVRAFGLGASLNFNDLPKFLLSKGYTKEDIIDSGVVNEVDGKLTDAQGGRLIYPIINAMDEVIAFGGRVLKKTDFAKYKNTRETLIFNKGKTLYNLNLLKKLRKTQTIKEIIMVEGYMDTISLYEAGFKNVVASMGTSLTQEQARLVKRYAETVYISYDGDGAGQKANMRGLEILKDEGLNVKVVCLPDGLDPDDVIKMRGVKGYQECLDKALPLIDYKLFMTEKSFDLSKTEDKRKFVAEAIKIIRTADSVAEQEELLKVLRNKSGITYESLNRDLNSIPQKEQQTAEVAVAVRKDNSTAIEKAARFVIAAYLFGAKYAEGSIDDIPFFLDSHEAIAMYIKGKILMEEKIRPVELFDLIDEGDIKGREELNFIIDLNDGSRLSGKDSEKYFNDSIKTLKLESIKRQYKELQELAKNEIEIEKRNEYMSQMNQLNKLKEKIKGGIDQ